MAGFDLVEPTVKLKSSFMDGLREFQAEGLKWHLELDTVAIEADFDSYVRQQLAKVNQRTDILVPATEFWAVWNGQYAGRIAVRHELTDALRIMGGHIGYDVRPRFRGMGIASLMLEEALPVARRLGLDRVLLTCDDTNAASIRVIEKNGGVLEDKKQIAADRPLKRYYWISL